ncbi:hypothetical protein ABZV75_11065 [Streptomyces flaveolus]
MSDAAVFLAAQYVLHAELVARGVETVGLRPRASGGRRPGPRLRR